MCSRSPACAAEHDFLIARSVSLISVSVSFAIYYLSTTINTNKCLYACESRNHFEIAATIAIGSRSKECSQQKHNEQSSCESVKWTWSGISAGHFALCRCIDEWGQPERGSDASRPQIKSNRSNLSELNYFERYHYFSFNRSFGGRAAAFSSRTIYCQPRAEHVKSEIQLITINRPHDDD